jgi:hypothetical protein
MSIGNESSRLVVPLAGISGAQAPEILTFPEDADRVTPARDSITRTGGDRGPDRPVARSVASPGAARILNDR